MLLPKRNDWNWIQLFGVHVSCCIVTHLMHPLHICSSRAWHYMNSSHDSLMAQWKLKQLSANLTPTIQHQVKCTFRWTIFRPKISKTCKGNFRTLFDILTQWAPVFACWPWYASAVRGRPSCLEASHINSWTDWDEVTWHVRKLQVSGFLSGRICRQGPSGMSGGHSSQQFPSCWYYQSCRQQKFWIKPWCVCRRMHVEGCPAFPPSKHPCHEMFISFLILDFSLALSPSQPYVPRYSASQTGLCMPVSTC